MRRLGHGPGPVLEEGRRTKDQDRRQHSRRGETAAEASPEGGLGLDREARFAGRDEGLPRPRENEVLEIGGGLGLRESGEEREHLLHRLREAPAFVAVAEVIVDLPPQKRR